MCGIAGIVDFGKACIPGDVEKMCRIMHHRGPDNQAIWADTNVCFGHVRLSIIDLSDAGNQPMINEHRDMCITYNGEIYNFKDLQKALKQQHVFTSRTDTEVLLHLWEESGTKVLPMLNGMYAFGVWDSKQQQLTLVRDPLGIKPVYYWYKNSMLVFASEIKGILASGVPRKLNYHAAAEHFAFQNTFGDTTFYRDIHLLPAGHLLRFDRKGIRTEKYSEVEFDETTVAPPPNAVCDEIRNRFGDAVQRQLLSDVPVGTYLSGGMDTGAISALAVRHVPGIHSFSCGFDTSNLEEQYRVFDESKQARELSTVLNTRHHELMLGVSALEENIVKTIWHLDEPRMGVSYQNLCIAGVVGRHVRVVLSGAGGDELFAGYPWRYRWCMEGGSERAAYAASVRFFDDNQLPSLFSDEMNRSIAGYSSFDRFRAVMAPCRAVDPVNRALFFDLKTFLNGILLVDDRLNMAHSVESRVPMLDRELIQLALSIPSAMKLADGTGKAILRQAMQAFLPAEVTTRTKRGFTPPDRAWMQQGTIRYIKDIILSKSARQRDIFDANSLDRIINEHCSGKKDHRFLLWSLTGFEWMMRLFFDTLVTECPE